MHPGTETAGDASTSSAAPGSATGPAGLSDSEAQARRARGLGNDVEIRSGRTYLEILRDNAFNPVNILLVVIALVLVALGLYGDAAVTIVLVVVNVVVGVVQEARAKHTLDRLSILTRPTATILRGGTERVVDQREVVLGDLLDRAPRRPADARRHASSSGAMEVDESLLTGESDRIPKHAGDEVLSGSVCVERRRRRYVATRVGARIVRQPADERGASLPRGCARRSSATWPG